MDTLKIKALLAAVSYGSLSRAAAEFCYTPSAFSHIADSFENELGVKILKRTPKGIELTPDGQALYEKLNNVIEAEKELFSAAAKLAEEKNQQFRIGTYSSISLHILSPLLKKFKEIMPEAKISISVGTSLGTWIDTDIADIVFADAKSLAHKNWIPIMNDPFIAAVPEGLFPGRESVSMEELYPFPYVATEESHLHGYLDVNKFREIVRIASGDDATVISLIKEGMGVAVLPSLVARDLPTGVRTLKLDKTITRTLCFAHRDDIGGALAEFVTFLKRQLNKELQ